MVYSFICQCDKVGITIVKIIESVMDHVWIGQEAMWSSSLIAAQPIKLNGYSLFTKLLVYSYSIVKI